jgi:hypothetical protein
MTTEIDPALTGAAYDLANAGYVPMLDPKEKEDQDPIGSDSASLREAAEQRAGANDPATERQYINADGNGPRRTKRFRWIAQHAITLE